MHIVNIHVGIQHYLSGALAVVVLYGQLVGNSDRIGYIYGILFIYWPITSTWWV